MKQLDKVALIAVILALISKTAPLLYQVYGRSNYSTYRITWMYTSMAMLGVILSLALSIAIGCWLYNEAKRENRSTWVWFLLGFMFQLIAVAVFILIPIYEKRSQTIDNDVGIEK